MTEFLTQLNDCWKSNILVVGATNLIENLDPSVLRPGRMDVHVFIGPPDIEARLELIKQFMQDRPQRDMNWPELAEKLEFYTSAEIEHLFDAAARIAFQGRSPITQQDIFSVVAANPPRLNKEMLEKMKKPIGFL